MARTKTFDVAILGAGVAGSFVAKKLGDTDLDICVIEFGRPPAKRRKQLEGWLGCFPFSNARLYPADLQKIENISGPIPTNASYKEVSDLLLTSGKLDLAKNREPSESIQNRLTKLGYVMEMNNYIQWKPESIHKLSRQISNSIVDKENFTFMFDTEIFNITKLNKKFVIETENGTVFAKKVVLGLGRSGWRFSNKIFKQFDILRSNNLVNYGFMGEISTSCVREWNESHCSLYKDGMKIGPLSFKGSIIQEDHDEFVICGWRSNEERWRSDKMAFSVLVNQNVENATEQTERLAKLAYVIMEDRVGKVRAKDFIQLKGELGLVPEYKALVDAVKEANEVFPKFLDKGYINFPNVITSLKDIHLDRNFKTKINGLYVCGESAGIPGLLSAAVSGNIVGNAILEENA